MKLNHMYLILVWVSISFAYCQRSINSSQVAPHFLGADMSYINEMENCGGVYRSAGKVVDPFQLFKTKGATVVRVRLWHSPRGQYSNFADVKKTIQRAKAQQMQVLLDFHYSDTWADPAHQNIPKAWEKITDITILGDSVYQYTLQTLLALSSQGLTPDLVQVGNEINSEIMRYPNQSTQGGINWQRNVFLLNQGIAAVRKASSLTGKTIGTMLHIAQPDDTAWWFKNAHQFGISDYDWIGLSYYPKWSKFDFNQLANTIQTLKATYQKRIMLVETGYPYTLINADAANNLLDAEGLNPAFPATPEGQKNFMIGLTQTVLKAGGEGVIYWEPAWISTPCKTEWAVGSHWDNALFFDASRQNEALPVFDFLNPSNYK